MNSLEAVSKNTSCCFIGLFILCFLAFILREMPVQMVIFRFITYDLVNLH